MAGHSAGHTAGHTAGHPGSPDELIAVVDPTGVVVDAVPRAVVRRDNLWHAATAVLVRDPAGRIYVHRRSPAKDWAPSHHDAAAGGLLRHGEDPRDSAVRELAEELGVTGVTLRPLGLSSYADDTTKVVEHCYEVTWDGPVTFPDAEVVWGAWMTLEELGSRLRDEDWPFVPDTRALLARLARDGTGDYRRLEM
jgi:8-oxo-dGTP pyrophosphatase MutT (NUDIX family)